MFSSVIGSTLTIESVMICLAASVICGLIISLVYKICEHPSKSFSITLALLPAIVQMVIMMVNGNLGVGVAVAGSFSLVKFRSLPGKASDILVIFLSMALGLCTGMGYVVFALALSIILAAVLFIFAKTPILDADTSYRNLRIVIPEDLDYTEVFNDIFKKYTKKADIQSVRTMNLGTMYQITYDIELRDVMKEKEMLDAIRVRNGNLAIISSNTPTQESEL